MTSITVRDLLRKLFRPSPRTKTPPRPRSFRPTLEFLEGRIVPAPVVTGVSPNNGPQSGATEVVITGSGFTGATSAAFGGAGAMYSVQSDSEIDVWSPYHTAGDVDVTVTTPSGVSPTSSADLFQFNLATTTISLSSSMSPSTYGNSVTLTATVSNTAPLLYSPTGTVTFLDGGTVLGTATLSSGWSVQATFSTSALALGDHSITAVYNGDSNFTGSTSSALSQNVTSSTAYVWTGADGSDPNDWNDPADWLVNGAPATSAPTSSSDVLFSGVQGTDINCSTPDDAAVAVNSLTMDSSYTGTLTANNELDVGSGGFNMAGGNIDQPNGAGQSDISVMGFFNWSAGKVNLGNVAANLLLYQRAVLAGKDLTTGDNIMVFGTTVDLANTGNLTFTNGAGVVLSPFAGLGAVFNWDRTANIKTTGNGLFVNNGGSLIKTAASGNGKVTCDLPYVGTSTSALLDIQNGGLVFDKAGGPSGVSVLQENGSIQIGIDNVNKATLEVDQGLTMTGGSLITAAGETCSITIGNVIISGGVVMPGGSGIGELDCDGSVAMSGGAYMANVDLTASTSDVWEADGGFQLAGSSELDVVSLNIPANQAWVVKTYWVLQTPAKNNIGGNFFNWTLAIGNTGVSYGVGPDATNMWYGVTP